MFYVPRHPSLYNVTKRTGEQCPVDQMDFTASVSNQTQPTHQLGPTSLDFPQWHRVFWISPYFQGLVVAIIYFITAWTVSRLTDSDGEVDEELVIELFQSDSYPKCVRDFFRLEKNVRRKTPTENKKMLEEHSTN